MLWIPNMISNVSKSINKCAMRRRGGIVSVCNWRKKKLKKTTSKIKRKKASNCGKWWSNGAVQPFHFQLMISLYTLEKRIGRATLVAFCCCCWCCYLLFSLFRFVLFFSTPKESLSHSLSLFLLLYSISFLLFHFHHHRRGRGRRLYKYLHFDIFKRDQNLVARTLTHSLNHPMIAYENMYLPEFLNQTIDEDNNSNNIEREKKHYQGLPRKKIA